MNSEKMIAKIQFEMVVQSTTERHIELMLTELYGDGDSYKTTSWHYGPFCPKGVIETTTRAGLTARSSS